MKKEYKPYTYLIGWSKLNIWYYGVETSAGKKVANPENLWTKYFTSSKYVKSFRKSNGEPDVIQVRKVFNNRNAACLWEEKVLKRMKVTKDPKWLNKSDGVLIDFRSMHKNTAPGLAAATAATKGKTYEEIYDEETNIKLRKKSSKVSKKNWKDPELRERMSKKTKRDGYVQAALRRWADPITREKMCKSMKRT